MVLNLEAAGKEAIQLLTGRAGLISTKNAKSVLNDFVNKAKEAMGVVQKELEAYKGKTAQEMADLTSKKDMFESSLEKAEKQLKNKTTAIHDIGNGKKIRVKTNPKTGASQVVEYNTLPDGTQQAVRISSKNSAGDELVYELNSKTGKMERVYDSIRPDDFSDQNVIIEKEKQRLADLKTKLGRDLTAEEAKPIVLAEYFDENNDTIRKMSDGTVQKIHGLGGDFYDVEITRGRDVIERQRKYCGNRTTELLNGNQRTFIEEKKAYSRRRELLTQDERAWEVLTGEEIKLANGTVGIAKNIPDEFGRYASKDVMNVTYPETSQLKSAVIERKLWSHDLSQGSAPQKATIVSKNGETYLMHFGGGGETAYKLKSATSGIEDATQLTYEQAIDLWRESDIFDLTDGVSSKISLGEDFMQR